MKTIHAVYEQGVFRPQETVHLTERTGVEFEPRPVQTSADYAEKVEAVRTAMKDELFLQDLNEVSASFSGVDAAGWATEL